MFEKSPPTENFLAFIEANKHYSKSFDQSELQPAPTKHFAILTCMDARMDPYKFAGLNDGEAHIIRNAGGRATDDAIRSLIISHKFLGTLEWFVIHHTNCGMTLVTDEKIGELLDDDLETAVFDGENWLNPPQAAVCAPHPANTQTWMVYIITSVVPKLLSIDVGFR